MSQERLIKLVSDGNAEGVGKGHTYYTTTNRRTHPDRKLAFRKYNPVCRAHTLYREKK